MKNIIKVTFAVFILLISCKENETKIENGSVAFSFNTDMLKSLSMDDMILSKIIISIEKEDGTSIYDMEEIDLFKVEDKYFSDPITLDAGVYRLTDFLVIDGNDNIIYVAPKVGSEMDYLVDKPLEITFGVFYNKLNEILVEVLSSSLGEPEKFGYASFSLNIIKPLQFCISVYENYADSSRTHIIDADIRINSGDSIIFEGSLNQDINEITIPKMQDYNITISKEGYSEYKYYFLFNTLTEFNCSNNNVLEVFLNRVLSLEGLVAHYPFNGNANDESYRNNHGTVSGAALVNDRFGNRNSAYHFNGTSDYIYMGDILDDVTTGTDKTFSFSLWIKRDNINTLRKLILSKNADVNCNATGRQYSIQLTEDNRIQFVWNHQLTLSHNWRIVRSTTNLSDTDTWYHIVVTYDGTIDTNNGVDRIKIYINGEETDCFLADYHGSLGDIADGSAYFALGNPTNTGGTTCGNYYFDGCIDDVFIFESVLSQSQISALYTQ